MSEGCEVTSSTMEGDKSAVEPQIDAVTLIKQLSYWDGRQWSPDGGRPVIPSDCPLHFQRQGHLSACLTVCWL